VIGNDHRQVEGAGRQHIPQVVGTLWIKASGKWIAYAEREQVFVPLDLAAVRRAMAQDKSDPVSDATRAVGKQSLRSSIETSFYAALNQSVVLHSHSQSLHSRFERMPRCVCRPAQRDDRVNGRRRPDVFVLANHGLDLCGDDCASDMALMLDVDWRLAALERSSPEPDLAALAFARIAKLCKHALGVEWL
jgi:hypothetical protein